MSGIFGLPPSLGYMLLPLLVCVEIALIHNYLGLHVLERKVIFVDLALAQVAALGTTFAFLLSSGRKRSTVRTTSPFRLSPRTMIFFISPPFHSLSLPFKKRDGEHLQDSRTRQSLKRTKSLASEFLRTPS